MEEKEITPLDLNMTIGRIDPIGSNGGVEIEAVIEMVTPPKPPTMKMTAENFLAYLDNCIDMWRASRDGARNERDKTLAIAYVDAFQSVRVTVFGSVKPAAGGAEVTITMKDEDFKPEQEQ